MAKDAGKPNGRSVTPQLIRPVNTDEEMKVLMENVATNPAKVEWPRDTWGFTSPLKKELLKAASNVKGDKDKHTLLTSVLIIAIKHLQARQTVDVEARKQQAAFNQAAQEDRLKRQRFYGQTPEAKVLTK
jgi:hypothetical protein